MSKKRRDRSRSFERLLLAALVAAAAVASPIAPLESAAHASDGGRRQAVITVKGMQCPFCAYGIKKHLAKVPGVEKVEVELAKNQATVYVAPDANVTDAHLQRAVRKAGFEASKIEWR
ncbi:MAG: heavy-metal-associated domain-containing protein [Acidobacteria bacterium]|nr:heavy-metal-associated domain-containing protein [Acidobacteriota bacterium]